MPTYSDLTFTITAGLSFNTNDFVKVAHNSSNYITGRVVSYNSSNGQLIVTPYEVVGSGTYNTWTVTLTGFNGSSGTAGTSGTSGTVGDSGSSGTAGTDGSSGTTGTSGTFGSSGTSGEDGSAGTSGEDGSIGTSGSSATSGTSGTVGTSGSSGTTGTSGTDGSTGTSGSSATSGTNGSSGSSGTSGNTGTSGSSGSSGTNGGPGPGGATGNPGPTGAQGGKGASGTSGATGPVGATGPTGSPGGQGPVGATGPQGPGGAPGPTGPAGPGGAQGPVGTSASYNQDLNNGGNVTFGNIASSGEIAISYRAKLPNFQGLYSSANQGVPWLGRSDAWFTSGAVGAAFFFNSSSKELKENIQVFTPSAVEILNDVDIVTYNFEIEQNDEDTRIGFIAEDTTTLLSGNNNDRMDTVSSIGLLLKSIQEIDKRITEIENKKNNTI